MPFRILSSHKALIFQIVSGAVSRQEVENFRTELSHEGNAYSLIMFDLSKATSIEAPGLKLLAEIGRSLQEQKQRVMVIANSEITQLIEKGGHQADLPCYVGVVPVGDETEYFSKKNKEIDGATLAKIVAPAVQENLKVYARLDVQIDPPTICARQNRPHVDIAGVGGFFCNNQKGNLLLGFQTASLLKIASAIMHRDYVNVESVVSDWAAELVNSVLGKVKTQLKIQGYSFSAGIPTVFSGKDLEVFYSTKLPSTIDLVRCSGTFGELFAEVIMATSD